MKTHFLIKFTVCIIFCLSLISCTEPYQLQTNTFEDALVVEATITNEFKKQQIKITHTYRLEENGPIPETGANVRVLDNMGNQYDFVEQNGIYESTQEFQAEPGRTYQLLITTEDGKQYTSNNQALTTVTPIESIHTNVITKEGQRGIQISVNSYDPSNTSKYYRYEYEETYKVIAPLWSANKAIIIDPDTPITGVDIALREGETRVCYTSKTSTGILLTNTAELSEDRVIEFPVRFIDQDDYTIANRYSILVKQYIQSPEAYIFYKTLKQISGSGNILSPNQPGFFSGNIKSADNPNEKVIGFFEIASVASSRIFFNYEDIFPNEPFPPYFIQCDIRQFDSAATGPFHANDGFHALVSYIRTNSLVFYSREGTIYNMVIPRCGDCTSFSSNVIPPFWQ